MTLDIVIIAVGVLVFVVPAAWSRLKPVAEERRRLDGERQRLAHERRRLAAAAQPASGGRRSGCPWCGFPISPPPG